MTEPHSELSAAERIIIAIDTSEVARAEQIFRIAQEAGARVVKMGLELSSAQSWHWCATQAYKHEVQWVADAKIDDTPNTTAATMRNISNLFYPPIGITVHSNSGIASMKAAGEVAGESAIRAIGVTHLTSIDDWETQATYRLSRNSLVMRRARLIANAELGGLVCSAKELKHMKAMPETESIFTMVPGTRSTGTHTQDQKNVLTPYKAIVEGADTLVIGRQMMQAKDPHKAYERIVKEIAKGLENRHDFGSNNRDFSWYE